MIIAKIGHASTNNTTNVANQVLIKENYSFEPTVVLRPKTYALAEKSALACEAGCNNNNILYSQDYRHTLNNKAKQTNYDLSDSAITTTCYADCSSFMTVCAIAGGGDVDLSDGIPTTSDMKGTNAKTNPFTKLGSYELLTDSIYLANSDYLKRGDILVRKGHTLMVLVSGSKVPDLNNIGLNLNITNIQIDKISAKIKVIKVEDEIEKALKDVEILNSYTWKYEVISLKENKAQGTKTLKVSSSSTNFSVSNLTHNTSYSIQIFATNKETKETVSSQRIIFNTLQVYPNSINKVNASFNINNSITDNFSVNFSETVNSLPSTFEKGYRLSLIVNGKIKAYTDSLVTSKNGGTFLINEVSKKQLFSLNDIVQIGIQSWVFDGKDYFFDSDFPSCSEPYFIKASMIMIDKIYLKINNSFAHTAIYHK